VHRNNFQRSTFIRAAVRWARELAFSLTPPTLPAEARPANSPVPTGEGHSSMTFLRTFFYQTFRKENQAAHLHPFGNDVADHLSPFALRIHPPEQHGPADAGEDDEDQQRVSPQEIQHGIVEMAEDGPAFG
jgi:hypothetical protein